MSYQEKIQELLKEHNKIKENLKNISNNKPSDFLTFGKIVFPLDCDYSLFSNNELVTQHVISHTLFTFSNRKGDIRKVHDKLVGTMVSRGLSHSKFDSLDNV